MPVISILASLIVFAIHAASNLSLMAGLVTSIAMLCGWSAQTGVWLECEVKGAINEAKVARFCPTAPLAQEGHHISDGLVGAKVGIALLITAALLIYTTLAAYGMIIGTKKLKRGVLLPKRNEMQLTGRFT